MHSHWDFDDAYSIFSAYDIKATYLLLQSGYINDLENFTLTVTSHFGVTYMLMIDIVDEFLTFANNNLTEETFSSFSLEYGLYRAGYTVAHGEVQGGLISLMRILNEKNSGLKLFESNSTFTSWQPKVYDSSSQSVSTGNCN